VALKDEGDSPSRKEVRQQRRRLKMLGSMPQRQPAEEVAPDAAESSDDPAASDPLMRRRVRLLPAVDGPSQPMSAGAADDTQAPETQLADPDPDSPPAASDANLRADGQERRRSRFAGADQNGAAESRSPGSKLLALGRVARSRAQEAVGALTATPASVPAPTDDISHLPRLVRSSVPQVKKPRWLTWSAIACIALPTLVVTLYFLFIATDQYAAEGRFAIRSSESTPTSTDSSSVMASLGLSSSSPTTADSYIVVEYLQSRRLVEDLQARLDLRKLYSNPDADWYARFDPNGTIENLVSYWQGMSSAYFDSMTGIVQVEVRAFSAADAQRIAAATLESAERLINDLSRRSRDDTVQFAKDDLSRAELRMKFARKAIRDFRDRQRQIDPTQIAAARISVLSSLESELAKEQSTRAMVNSFLNSDAPSVRMMENKITALRDRIAEERNKLGTTGDNKGDTEIMSSIMAEYEELATDREFAETLYKSSLASLEAARIAAERKMRYVASFVEPKRAERAMYPQRFKNIILVFLSCCLAWIVGVLIIYGIRDHTI
jgi:capsular polysaccharide transport system permease protein